MLGEEALQLVAGHMKTALNSDPMAMQRQAIRQYFLGDYAAGQSTEAFVSAVTDVIALRDEELASCRVAAAGHEGAAV